MWLTCRRETGATDYTWHANVSGYRVLANGVVDMDSASISLWSTTPGIDVPDWLMGLIKKYAPSLVAPHLTPRTPGRAPGVLAAGERRSHIAKGEPQLL